MRRVLAPSFHTSLASTEGQIRNVIEDLEFQAIVLDLDVIGDCAEDGLEVLGRDAAGCGRDMVMIAVTGSSAAANCLWKRPTPAPITSS